MNLDDLIPESVKTRHLEKGEFDKDAWLAAAALRSKKFQTALKQVIKAERTGKKKYIAHFAFLAYVAGVKDGVELCANNGVPPKDIGFPEAPAEEQAE